MDIKPVSPPAPLRPVQKIDPSGRQEDRKDKQRERDPESDENSEKESSIDTYA